MLHSSISNSEKSILSYVQMGKRDYHQLNFKQANVSFNQLDSDQASCAKRTKFFHDMTTVSLPQDMVGVTNEMAIHTHWKDLNMLPNVSKFLWWRPNCSYYPAFEFPSNIFQPKWLDTGLVSVQKIDHADNENIRQLPAVVRYVIFEYACNKTRYSTLDITSTLMERSTENPQKVYYPYQIWKIRPSYHDCCSDMWVRPPHEVEEETRIWESYWSNPLKPRVHRVEAFVTELINVLQNREFWTFFDGRRVALLPKIWLDSQNLDNSKLGTQDCESLLRQFREDPESLDLPPEVRAEFSRIYPPS